MRLRRYITEKVKKTGNPEIDRLIKELPKWQSDLRKLTKAYKAIPNNETNDKSVKIMDKVHKAFGQFSKSFENWVYGTLLTRYKKMGDENNFSWYEQNTQKMAWQFITGLTAYGQFPESYDYKTQKHYTDPYMLDKSSDTKRDTHIRRYQRYFRFAMEAIQEMFEAEHELIKTAEYKETEQFKIGASNIVIHNYGKADWHKKYIDIFIKTYKMGISKIKKAGFKNVDQDLTVHLYYTAKAPDTGGANFLTGGNYNRNNDTLNIFIMGMDKDASTLIHELGHRIYFKFLPSQAQKSWEKIIEKRKLTVTSRHMNDFFAVYYRIKDGYEYWDEFQKGFAKELEKIADDPISLAAMNHLFKRVSGIWWNEEDKVENIIRGMKGDEINLEHITDYGDTDAYEAFADAFRKYVINGPRSIGAWTRSFFEDDVGAGGYNIKEGKESMDLVDKYPKESTGR